MARPSEYASRDIVSLAVLDIDDATLMSDGVAWVRLYKGLVKPLAKSLVENMGGAPEMASPAAHKENSPNWYK